MMKLLATPRLFPNIVLWMVMMMMLMGMVLLGSLRVHVPKTPNLPRSLLQRVQERLVGPASVLPARSMTTAVTPSQRRIGMQVAILFKGFPCDQTCGHICFRLTNSIPVSFPSRQNMLCCRMARHPSRNALTCWTLQRFPSHACRARALLQVIDWHP